jgi:hypothetical protein
LLGLGGLAARTLPRWLSWLTVGAGLGQLLSVAVPALDVLQLLFYVWCLAVSGWLLARGSRTTATAGEPAFA